MVEGTVMQLYDYPMKCCGMVEAFNINAGIPETGTIKVGEFLLPVSTDEDWEVHFKKIEEHQRKHRRNCAMMTLSSVQTKARGHAERLGWKNVFEFYNPNSYHDVGIYVKVLWDSREAYQKEVDSGQYEIPMPAREWTHQHNEALEEENT
jgi:hypothetical protein